MAQDYYEILQVHPRADADAIAASYQRLRELYDPARLDGAADELIELARQRRDAIERAYAVLSDPVRRTAYDQEQAALAPAKDARPTTNDQRPGRQGDKETRRQGDTAVDLERSAFSVQRSAF